MIQSVFNQLLLFAPAFWPLSSNQQEGKVKLLKQLYQINFGDWILHIELTILDQNYCSENVQDLFWGGNNFGKMIFFLKSCRQSPYKRKTEQL